MYEGVEGLHQKSPTALVIALTLLSGEYQRRHPRKRYLKVLHSGTLFRNDDTERERG